MTQDKARFDLKAAKAAFDTHADLGGGFFVMQPEGGPLLREGADQRAAAAHGEHFRTELRAALKTGETGQQTYVSGGGAISGSNVMADLAPPAPKGAEAPSGPATLTAITPAPAPVEAAEGERAEKRRMTVRRFLLGF